MALQLRAYRGTHATGTRAPARGRAPRASDGAGPGAGETTIRRGASSEAGSRCAESA